MLITLHNYGFYSLAKNSFEELLSTLKLNAPRTLPNLPVRRQENVTLLRIAGCVVRISLICFIKLAFNY